MPTDRSVLTDPAFIRLWTGTTASGLATWALPFILGLALAEGTVTAVDLGLLLAVRTAGFLVSVPVAGVIADRYSRRRVIVWACGAAALAAPVIAWGITVSLPIALVAAAVTGAGQGACRPAFQALVTEVVAPHRRQPANAAVTFAVRGSVLLAPGVTVAVGQWLDVVGLIMMTGALWMTAALAPPAGTHRGAGRGSGGLATDFGSGVREAGRHRWFLAGLAALATVITTGYSVTGVVLPIVSAEDYGGEAVLAGAMTAYTFGALIGAVLMSRWQPRRPGWVALVGLAGYALAPVSLVFAGPAVTVFVAYTVVGVGVEVFNVGWFTSVQREVAADKLARVSSLDFMVSYGLAPVGLALIAPAVEVFGTAPVLWVCAGACLVAPVWAMTARGARDFVTGRRRLHEDAPSGSAS